MKVTGYYYDANPTFDGKVLLTVSINEKRDAVEQINQMNKEDLLDIEIKKHRKKRTLDANALLWACIGDIAKSLGTDKWEIYLRCLKSYGQFTYVVCKRKAVESFKQQWRECEEVGTVDIHGEEGVQLLCYFGSSTYNTEEFSKLLDGVINEMYMIGLQPPPPKSIQKGLEAWERIHRKQN